MQKAFAILIVITGWFALVTQYYLMIDNREASLTETTIRFFSFFTILTNLLVAALFTREVFTRTNPVLFTATTVYITIVGAVYQLLLRGLWHPTGMQKLVDELLHTFIPLFAVLYWYIYKRSTSINYKHIPAWLLYPLGYLCFILLRGFFSNLYPYPFIDVTALGYAQVLINSAALTLAFVLVSFFFVWLGR